MAKRRLSIEAVKHPVALVVLGIGLALAAVACEQQYSTPTVDAVDPAEGTQGETLAVAINGSDFQDGASSDFGAGITVNSTSFVSSTELTANITIAAAAAPGPRTVTVTNPDGQSGTEANAFVVMRRPRTHTVIMNNFVFVPDALTIRAGDTVIWRHEQDGIPHTSTSGIKNAADAGAIFDSRGGVPNARMREPDTFSQIFNDTGTFPYHCVVHGVVNPNGSPGGMSGTIMVNP